MAQSFKNNQGSLYYRPADVKFLVVIIVFNKYKYIIHRQGILLKVLTYLMHRFTAPRDLLFDSYAGLYGYNDLVLITE